MPHPGAVVNVAVQFLTPEQLEQMHASERVGVSYGFAKMAAENLSLDNFTAHACFFYYSLYGALRDEGEPIALAEVECRGRRWRALRQCEVQALVRRRLRSNVNAHEFLLETICHEHIRRERIAHLSSDGLVYQPERETPEDADCTKRA
jgi:hypothetical protein